MGYYALLSLTLLLICSITKLVFSLLSKVQVYRTSSDSIHERAVGPVFVAVQQPAQVALQQFGVSLCLSVWYFGAQHRAHGAQVGGEAPTDERFIQIRQ